MLKITKNLVLAFSLLTANCGLYTQGVGDADADDDAALKEFDASIDAHVPTEVGDDAD